MHASPPVTAGSFDPELLELFWWFVCERQAIWHRRTVERRPPPWTADAVLARERFTNVYRELDPGTRYAIEKILEIAAPRPDKIFNVMLYRLIGRAETHAAIGFQSLAAFDPERLARALRALRDAGRPPFTAAYMVGAHTAMGTRDKAENIARLFGLLHRGFDALYARIEAAGSAAEVYETLRTAYGFGNFLAYQVLVDLLYPLDALGGVPLLPYAHDDWASAGPGARRGIGMLLRPDTRAPHLAVMRWLREHQDAEFARFGLSFPHLRDRRDRPVPISLANIQNCLCEFHKYVKIGTGTGRGRRRFVPGAPGGVQLRLPLAREEGRP
ncbi:MAG TPA: nucleotide kinase domain-containing protein [Thermomicrobiales bacterium]|nr:nucleotide kinase domain-containing protein [Thermomicrobiales bacterium]